MLVLNRRGPTFNLVGSSVGFVKDYNADRKARKNKQENSDSDGGHNVDHE